MAKYKKPKGESHVRIYIYEKETPAYRTLGVEARSLLVELRSLYRPSTANKIFLSVRDAMQRLGIGQRRGQVAFGELLERGWIEIDTPGGFTQKTRHATSYRLTNEANGSPGGTASKAFMRWRPSNHDEKTR